ncbi:MAG: GNAT family N-acetyltransferase [Desulfobacterales bacterium]|nr:GNAT family N-acetyltransferase [Desulfobacterales bacterium]
MHQSISESELLRLADLNLVEFWIESSKWVPHTEILYQKDAVLINSAIDYPGCNFAFNLSLEPYEDAESFLDLAKTYFARRKKGFSLLFRKHLDQKIIRYCKENKIFLVSESPGMVLDEPIADGVVPIGAKLHWVNNDDKLQGFKQVVAEAYQDLGFPKEVSEKYFDAAQRVISPQFFLAVVYLDNEPACTALALLSHGIGGVYWVGTTKKARGRGLAEYCTREVSNAAFDCGARKVVLQASKFGQPIYLKMGYREFTTYPWFICSSKSKHTNAQE